MKINIRDMIRKELVYSCLNRRELERLAEKARTEAATHIAAKGINFEHSPMNFYVMCFFGKRAQSDEVELHLV